MPGAPRSGSGRGRPRACSTPTTRPRAGSRTAARASSSTTTTAAETVCDFYALHPGEAPLAYAFMERYADQAAVDAHRGTEYFKALGRKMGEYMDGRAEVVRLREVG